MVKTLEFPAHLELETTNFCQLACIMCPHRIMKRKKGFMSKETIVKIANEAKGRAKTCYLHMIGEPLLHPRILEYIEVISRAGILTSLSTNAVLLNESMARSLFSSRLDELTLCLDSLNKNTFEHLRVGAKYETVYCNIVNALKLRRTINSSTQVEVQLIVTRYNYIEVEEFKRRFSPLVKGIGRIRVKDFSTFAGKVDDLGVSKTPSRLSKCRKLFNSTAILWNGDVVLCCRDYEGITKVGNVMEKPLIDIWTSNEYIRYRRAFLERDWETLSLCRKC